MTRYAPLWQQAGSYPSALDRSLILAIWPNGNVLQGAFTLVNNTMNVSLAPGTAVVPLQAGQGAALCRWDAPEVVTLTAAPGSGTSRRDTIICQVRDNALDGGPNNDFIFSVLAGVPAASNPVAPAVPVNAMALYDIIVPGAVANLNTATPIDRRPNVAPYGRIHCGSGTTLAGSVAVSFAASGNPVADFLGGGMLFEQVAQGSGLRVPVPGIYRATGNIKLQNGVSVSVQASLGKNNVVPVSAGSGGYNAQAAYQSALTSDLIKCAAGDVINLGYTASGICAFQIDGNGISNWLAAELVQAL